MATGYSFRRTVKGSDESFDLVCSPCVKKNINREGTQYCVDCHDFYCSTCVKCHEDLPVLSGHKILDKSDSEFPTDGSKVTLPTEKCSIHTKLMDMYCQNHDQIGCHVCMAVKHRSCKDVFYIPEEIDNLLHVGDTKPILENLTKANDELNHLIGARHLELYTVNKDKNDTLNIIKIFRQKINTTLDELEKMTKDTFKANHAMIQKKFKSDIASMEDIVKDLEAYQQKLQLAEGNRSQQFVCMKKCEENLLKSKTTIKEVAKCPTISIEFETDDSIMRLLSELKSLGNITEKSTSKSAPVQQHLALYKVIERQEYEVNAGCDSMDGSCILTDGTLLLTYYGKQKLKRLDSSTYKVIDECDMPYSPAAVCEISPQEAGVTLNNNTIQLVSLGSKMAPTRSIKMSHRCFGLAVSNGEMFVSDFDYNVHVHDTSGTLLRTISTDQSGANIFRTTSHIRVSDDGSKIYVADTVKGVIVLERNGRVLSRYCDPELSGARGVCTDGCGNVFVCVNASSNVLQIGPSGHKTGVIVNQSDGISRPLTVCYDRSTSRLIVTKDSKKNITVLNLA